MKQMKKSIIYTAILAMFGIGMNAQVAIGKQSINGNSTILDFAETTATDSPTDQETANYKGIILSAVEASPVFPVVTPLTNNPNNGTFLYDKATSTVRMFENGTWVNLSDEGSNANLINNPSAENTSDGVIIGAEESEATGVLVLEPTNKALILPHIKNPHSTVKSRYAGLMCYDTASNSLGVFDGSVWSYWK